MLKKTLMLALPVAVVAALGFGAVAYADEPAADVAEPEVATQEVAADVADVAEEPAADEPSSDIVAQAQNGWSQELSEFGISCWYYYVDGVRVTGWKQIGGKWYFFDPYYYQMATGYWATTDVDDWAPGSTFHMFDANGVWVNKTGWYWNDVNHAWSYLENGKCAGYGWKQINGKWYYFLETKLQTGPMILDGNWYFLGDDGALRTGWFKWSNGKWGYASSSGVVRINGWVTTNGKTYFVDNNGEMLTDMELYSTAERSYYFGPDGALVIGWYKCTFCDEWHYTNSEALIVNNGWVQSGGKWYYIENRAMVTGDYGVDGVPYYFLDNGVMATGWFKKEAGSAWSYAEASGKVVDNGWVKSNGKWYFIRYGYMVYDNWVKDNDKWYYMAKDGTMVTSSWLNDGAWYYLMANGQAATGWYKVGGYWYYFFPEEGDMAANTTTWIDDVCYKFDAHGKWTKIAG